MKRRSILLGLLAAGCLLAVAVPAARKAEAAPNKIQVHGVVYDGMGKELEGVIVVIVPSDRNASGNSLNATTDNHGRYDITETIDGPFDIFYRHPLVGSVSVSRLSSESNQEIAKVLERDPTADGGRVSSRVRMHLTSRLSFVSDQIRSIR